MATAAARQTGGSVRVTLWILLIVYIFNFIDRQIVNILAEPIRLELGLSDTQIGLMTGLAFALFYTILGLPIARFSDRSTTNRPWLIGGALAIWSAMTALCGLAQNFIQLLLARIGVGVGEAGCTPPAHSLIGYGRTIQALLRAGLRRYPDRDAAGHAHRWAARRWSGAQRVPDRRPSGNCARRHRVHAAQGSAKTEMVHAAASRVPNRCR